MIHPSNEMREPKDAFLLCWGCHGRIKPTDPVILMASGKSYSPDREVTLEDEPHHIACVLKTANQRRK